MNLIILGRLGGLDLLFLFFRLSGLETAQSLAGICQVLSGNVRVTKLLDSIKCNTFMVSTLASVNQVAQVAALAGDTVLCFG